MLRKMQPMGWRSCYSSKEEKAGCRWAIHPPSDFSWGERRGGLRSPDCQSRAFWVLQQVCYGILHAAGGCVCLGYDRQRQLSLLSVGADGPASIFLLLVNSGQTVTWLCFWGLLPLYILYPGADYTCIDHYYDCLHTTEKEEKLK